MRSIAIAAVMLVAATTLLAQSKPRARDLGVPFEGTPGPNNAITDVGNVTVGHTTLISGNGALVVGKGPVRTGVTAVLPRGKDAKHPVFAAWFSLNGNGEMTGTTWVQESGFLAGPVIITNTNSVGVARDAVVAWQLKANPEADWSLPVVAETYDGMLNDINGFHVKPADVWNAIETASGGRVQEGSVGGGTGMICNGFKGGIGTSSRVAPKEAGGYTIGVLVQCNYGGVRGLRIAGAPVGRDVTTFPMCMAGSLKSSSPFLRGIKPCTTKSSMMERPKEEAGSIIIVIATDAPLLPSQLARVVKRAALGIGREGGIASNYSGDIFIAFSTANLDAARSDTSAVTVTMIPNESMDILFIMTVLATEEAITNAMVAAETMIGADSLRVEGLPHKWLQETLKKYNRLDSTVAR